MDNQLTEHTDALRDLIDEDASFQPHEREVAKAVIGIAEVAVSALLRIAQALENK